MNHIGLLNIHAQSILLQIQDITSQAAISCEVFFSTLALALHKDNYTDSKGGLKEIKETSVHSYIKSILCTQVFNQIYYPSVSIDS